MAKIRQRGKRPSLRLRPVHPPPPPPPPYYFYLALLPLALLASLQWCPSPPSFPSRRTRRESPPHVSCPLLASPPPPPREAPVLGALPCQPPLLRLRRRWRKNASTRRSSSNSSVSGRESSFRTRMALVLSSPICNCLILRGMGVLDQNRDEFSLKELLNSVGNALIDSNSNIENEDAGYEEYHGQETEDPFELLLVLRLAFM
ncbi:BEN domain-containing protein 4-like [Eucalyptus grandis]|uniref:BEN domain-containing protein 4-like n=1 Tax=Eucalyptus grandis TaxID=71139 RepID=UPI00192E79B7|nr:BEN domain-containing protein 4-like [Eucalyptus grandis]